MRGTGSDLTILSIGAVTPSSQHRLLAQVPDLAFRSPGSTQYAVPLTHHVYPDPGNGSQTPSWNGYIIEAPRLCGSDATFITTNLCLGDTTDKAQPKRGGDVKVQLVVPQGCCRDQFAGKDRPHPACEIAQE